MWNPSGVHMMEIHVQALLHPAATERLARETRLPPRPWLYRLKCWWLCRLGRFLVAVGQRLQRFGLLRGGAIEGRVLKESRFEA